jgi:serine protease Do
MIKKFFMAVAIAVVVSFLFQARIEWPQQSRAQKNKAWTEGTPGSYTPSSALSALNSAFKELGSVVAPTVVNIFTVSKVAIPGAQGLTGPQAELFRYFFGNPFGGPGGFGSPRMPSEREQNSAGSGFVINKEGLIVTNSHVVRMNDRVADQIRINFIGENEAAQGTTAEVVGVDPLTDVAVIRIKGMSKEKLADLKVAPLGNSDDVAVGEIVFAVGNPYGHTHSVTQGIVSALGREVDINASSFIQTDASINPGNSGGPLFNIKGEVIGINTAIDARAQGIGFAIPINSAKRVIEQLVEKGSVTWGYIGVSMQPLDERVAKSLGLPSAKGALIVGVEQGGPAEKAGLRSYDVVTKVNNRVINSVRDLSVTVRSLSPGSKVNVEYIREGKTRSASLSIGQRQDAPVVAQSQGSSPRGGQSAPRGQVSSKLGVELSELTPSLRNQLGIPAGAKGVVVTRIAQGGLGEEMGLTPGDLITEINKKPITSIKDVDAALDSNKKAILLKIQNGESERVLSVDFGG